MRELPEYTPKQQFDLQEYLNSPIREGQAVMPGIDAKTIDEQIQETCDAIRTEETLIAICAWNEDKEALDASMRNQEQRKHEQDPEYIPKGISHTICEYHRKLMTQDLKGK